MKKTSINTVCPMQPAPGTWVQKVSHETANELMASSHCMSLLADVLCGS